MANNMVFQYKKKQAGAMLIEALLAAIIIGVSITALLKTELATISDTRAVNSNQQAIIMMWNIIDRMRNNPEAAATGSYEASGSPGGGGACIECGASAIATQDLREWFGVLDQKKSEGDLPDVTAEIIYNGGTSYQIIIRWKEYHANSVAARLTPEVERELSQNVII